MKEIKAPLTYYGSDRPWLFLAGSIEMGTARLELPKQPRRRWADPPHTGNPLKGASRRS